MIDRFQGVEGRRRLVSALTTHKVVCGNTALAEALADLGDLVEFQSGATLIEMGAFDNDVYLLLSGSVDILVKGSKVASRGPSDVVGEMAAVDPALPRSATVVASLPIVAIRVSEPQIAVLSQRHPEVFRQLCVLLARKLEERNHLVRDPGNRIRVFVISSVEALDVARAVHTALDYDKFDVIPWNEGVFRVTSYTLKTLEDELDRADFAIAIAHGDDQVQSKNSEWPAPRDNVIFELGLFMGRLGTDRAILMEPRDDKVKLPSDLAGITTITYRFDPSDRERAAKLAPACNRLRDYIAEKGPRR